MAKNNKYKSSSKKPAATNKPVENSNKPVVEQSGKRSLYNFSSFAALFIISSLVTAVALSQSVQKPYQHPEVKPGWVAPAPVKSVLASVAVAPSSDIGASTEPAATPATATGSEFPRRQTATTPTPPVRPVQTAAAPATAPASPEPQSSTTIPVATDKTPPKPPREETKPESTPQPDNGIGQLINDLLSAIL